MPTKAQARQEKRMAQRRQQILNAAAKIFAEKGFQKATTREIADVAEISEGTIYNYFENKDDLLLGLIDRMAEQNVSNDLFNLQWDNDFKENTIEMLLAVLPEILITPKLRERYREKILTPIAAMLEGNIAARIASGEQAEIDMALFSRFLLGTAHGMFMMLILGDPVISKAWAERENIVELMLRFIFEGIRPFTDET